MANFRLEWLHVNEVTGDIIDVAGVVKETLAENTHHQFTPPGKLRRHSRHLVARIVYSGANLFIRADSPDAAQATTDNAYRFRYGLDADGREKQDHNVRFQVDAGEVLHVHYTSDADHSYVEP